MTDNSPKLHELTGQIVAKELRKVYNKSSPYHGNTCYKLTLKEQEQEDWVFVYSNIVSPTIWKTIQQSQYLDQRYLFFCEKRPRGFLLHNWRPLTENNPQ